jgi:hypothetical protein
MSSKDLLFLSSTSQQCQLLSSFIMSNGLRDRFLLIYVDLGKYTIPQCIRQIPTLLTKDKKLIVEEKQIMQYIESFVTKQATVSTFNWERDNFSPQYSCINEDDSHGNITPQQFTLLNDPDMIGGQGVGIKEDCTKQNKFDASAYETYIASRNKDEEEIKRQYNQVNRY